MKKFVLLLSLAISSVVKPAKASNLEDGLVARYLFDNNTDDSSGNNYHGVPNNVNISTDRFNTPNSAYLFESNGDSRITIPSNSGLNFTNSFSISIWAKINEPWLFKSQCLIYQGPIDGPFWFIGINQDDSQYGIQNYSTQGLLRQADDPTGDSDRYVESIQSYNSISEWNMYTIVFGESQMNFYFNDVLKGTVTTESSINFNTNDIVVGGQIYTDWASSRTLDDIYIYNRALTSEEVQELYLVPEPSALSLLAVGLGVVLRRRRRTV